MRARRGYTLIELVVAIASASVLMVGLSSALFVSAQALEMDNGATLEQSRAEQALARMVTDLGEATRFEVFSSNAARFYVPDRDGDGLEEELAYSWSGVAGAPLMLEQDGRSAALLKDVASLDLHAITRSVAAQDVTIPINPPYPVVESFSSVEVDPIATALVLPTPAGVVTGELLIAAVAIDEDRQDSLAAPSGWTLIDLGVEQEKVTFGVWWKLATSSEPADYTWTWTDAEEAVGVGLRISNQHPTSPISIFSTANGKSSSPGCAAVTTAIDQSLVIRWGGFRHNQIGAPGDTGLSNHVDVYMNGVGNGVSLGAGYRVQEQAGDTGTASFALTGSKEYRTVTVAISPEAD